MSLTTTNTLKSNFLFTSHALVVVAIMYYLGLLSPRTPTQVEICFDEKVETRTGVPSRTVWDQCVEENKND